MAIGRYEGCVLALMMGDFNTGGVVTAAALLGRPGAIVRADLQPPMPPFNLRSRLGRNLRDRVVDRTVGCSGQTSAMHLDNFTTQVWTFTGGPPSATDADWVKQEAGTDRRCFTTTRKRENVLLQAKVCQAGNGGPAVNVLAGAMQNTLGQ